MIEQFQQAYHIVMRAVFEAYLSNKPLFAVYADAAIGLDFAIQTELEFVDDAI